MLIPGNPSALVEPLAGRELEVLRLVCAGRSNRQIAEELFVTVGTVKAQLHTIHGKLPAVNRVEAIVRAQRSVSLADRRGSSRTDDVDRSLRRLQNRATGRPARPAQSCSGDRVSDDSCAPVTSTSAAGAPGH